LRVVYTLDCPFSHSGVRDRLAIIYVAGNSDRSLWFMLLVADDLCRIGVVT